MVGDALRKYQLQSHLKSLLEWQKQVELDYERAVDEVLHSATESVRLSSAITKVKKELETLNDNTPNRA